jgi:uncharacterized integral membrane protein
VRLLLRVLAAAFAVVAVIFALANRAPVTISLSPLPVMVELPLYLLVLGALAVGVAAGGMASWIAAGRRRRAERTTRRQLVATERELVDTRTRRAGSGGGA